MKRKLLPPFIMLTAGLIVSIRTYFFHYDTKTWLIILLVVLIVFYALGSGLKFLLDTFDKENEKKALDEGEVIEKEAEEESETEDKAENSVTKE